MPSQPHRTDDVDRLRTALDILVTGHEEILLGVGLPEEVSAGAIKRAAAALTGAEPSCAEQDAEIGH